MEEATPEEEQEAVELEVMTEDVEELLFLERDEQEEIDSTSSLSLLALLLFSFRFLEEEEEELLLLPSVAGLTS